MPPRNRPRRLALLAALGLLQACSWSMPVPQAPTEGPRAAQVGDRLPIAAGVYFDEAFLALRRQATVTGGHRAILPVGEIGAAEFQAACERRFRSCVRLASGTPLPPQAAAGLNLVLEPRIEEVRIAPPPLLGWAGHWDIGLVWTIDAMTPVGRRIAETRVEGRGTNEDAVDWSASGMAHSSQALAVATRRLAEDYLRRLPTIAPGIAP